MAEDLERSGWRILKSSMLKRIQEVYEEPAEQTVALNC